MRVRQGRFPGNLGEIPKWLRGKEKVGYICLWAKEIAPRGSTLMVYRLPFV